MHAAHRMEKKQTEHELQPEWMGEWDRVCNELCAPHAIF